MIKLSVIIPIYKVENYIIECLESICCQLVEGVEVILVNDGTPDRSMIVAKEYINENYSQYLNQFVFIDQKNQGQSVARNNALNMATGDYIAFLDSDDVLAKNYFNTVLRILSKNQYDILRFNAKKFIKETNENIIFDTSVGSNGENYINEDFLIELFNKAAWYPWLNIYSKKLFDGLVFPVGVYFEDAAIITKIFIKSNAVYFINKNLYYYRLNPYGSLLGKDVDNLKKQRVSYEYIVELFSKELVVNKIYSPSYIIVFQAYIMFLFKNFGIKVAFIEYCKWA